MMCVIAGSSLAAPSKPSNTEYVRPFQPAQRLFLVDPEFFVDYLAGTHRRRPAAVTSTKGVGGILIRCTNRSHGDAAKLARESGGPVRVLGEILGEGFLEDRYSFRANTKRPIIITDFMVTTAT